jgi:hypothetical protein
MLYLIGALTTFLELLFLKNIHEAYKYYQHIFLPSLYVLQYPRADVVCNPLLIAIYNTNKLTEGRSL